MLLEKRLHLLLRLPDLPPYTSKILTRIRLNVVRIVTTDKDARAIDDRLIIVLQHHIHTHRTGILVGCTSRSSPSLRLEKDI
jgi:hypothetical protein